MNEIIVNYPPISSGILLYWKNEKSGHLKEAIFTFVRKESLTDEQLNLIKDYCKHWANYRDWLLLPHQTAVLERLKEGIDSIETSTGLWDWLDDALTIGIDPL